MCCYCFSFSSILPIRTLVLLLFFSTYPFEFKFLEYHLHPKNREDKKIYFFLNISHTLYIFKNPFVSFCFLSANVPSATAARFRPNECNSFNQIYPDHYVGVFVLATTIGGFLKTMRIQIISVAIQSKR